MNLSLRDNVLIGMFSFAFSFFCIYIYVLEETKFDGIEPLIVCWDTFILFLLVFFLLNIFYKKIYKSYLSFDCSNVQKNDNKSSLKYYVIVSLVIFICWVPVYMAYYPAIFGYDIMMQIFQPINGYTTHHPLLHTLYMSFFYHKVGGVLFEGNYTRGIAISIVFQMIMMAFMLSYAHFVLYQLRVKKYIRYILIGLTGVLPNFSMIVIATTKDALFAGFIAVFFSTIVLYALRSDVVENKILYQVILVISLIGLILFRNNGVYPAICVVFALYINAMFKKKWKIFVLALCGLVVGIFINSGLKSYLNASSGSINEILSIPLQQMSCAYNDNEDKFSETDREVLLNYIPDVEYYEPSISDNVKYRTTADYNLGEFLKFYIHIGLKYPRSYIKGFCLLNAGYLSLADVSFASIYGTDSPKPRQGVFLSDVKDGADIVHISRFKALENLYEELYTQNKYSKVFILNILCHPAFYFWIVMFCLLTAIIDKNKKAVIPFTFLLVLMLTIIAGPCVLERYAFAYIVCIPPLLALTGIVKCDNKDIEEAKN